MSIFRTSCTTCHHNEPFSDLRFSRVEKRFHGVRIEYLADVEIAFARDPDWDPRPRYRVLNSRVEEHEFDTPAIYSCLGCGHLKLSRVAEEAFRRCWAGVCHAIVCAVVAERCERPPETEEDFVLRVRMRQYEDFYRDGRPFVMWWTGWITEKLRESDASTEMRYSCSMCQRALFETREIKIGTSATIMWASERRDLLWLDLTRADVELACATHASECAMRIWTEMEDECSTF